MPGAPLPLHIFEPRYRQLTVDLVTGKVPDKQFGVIAVREGWAAGDETATLHRVGCTAELLDVRRLPDGRFDIVTRGSRRFRLLDVDTEARPYLMAEVEYLPDLPGRVPGDSDDTDDADNLADLAGAARAAHRRYCTTAWKNGDWSEPADDITPAELPHLLAADCLLPLDSPRDPPADGAGAPDPRGRPARRPARRPRAPGHLRDRPEPQLTRVLRSCPRVARSGTASSAFRYGPACTNAQVGCTGARLADDFGASPAFRSMSSAFRHGRHDQP
jgi:Lon protease-like protein